MEKLLKTVRTFSLHRVRFRVRVGALSDNAAQTHPDLEGSTNSRGRILRLRVHRGGEEEQLLSEAERARLGASNADPALWSGAMALGEPGTPGRAGGTGMCSGQQHRGSSDVPLDTTTAARGNPSFLPAGRALLPKTGGLAEAFLIKIQVLRNRLNGFCPHCPPPPQNTTMKRSVC